MHWLLAMLMPCATAFGGTILSYTFDGTATGTIGSIPFNNAMLTVGGTADADAVTCSAGICSLNLAAGADSFTIDGIGSGTFSDASYFFDNQNGGIAGFGVPFRPLPCCDMIDMDDSSISSNVFATYDLQSAIGPVGQARRAPVVITGPQVRSGDWCWGLLSRLRRGEVPGSPAGTGETPPCW